MLYNECNAEAKNVNGGIVRKLVIVWVREDSGGLELGQSSRDVEKYMH